MTDHLLHLEELQPALVEQITLTTRAGNSPLVKSYIRNMGVCPGCLAQIAANYADDQLLVMMKMIVSEAPSGNAEVVEEITGSTMMAMFVRGFTVGLVLGRKHQPR